MRSTFLFPLLLSGVVVVTSACAGESNAPAAVSARATPTLATPRPEPTLARGRKLFLNSCAHCHGDDASGDEGPDLHDLDLSDRRITTVIQRGIKGEMPSFAKKHSLDEIAALIAYLRTLHDPGGQSASP